jgi:hypothetical protein
MAWSSYRRWRPYVPVAERRRRAAGKVAKMKQRGRTVSPVEIDGRTITRTFWGNAWCKNLESYSDYSNRLPRGRTYVRNGSVVDLQIQAGGVQSLVSGSSLYSIDIKIKPLAKPQWTTVKGKCAGQIDSLVELLRGSLAKGVMEIVTRKGEGLFPAPHEISLSCSCPDWATMCKHVAATLYGVGARLDDQPELLFTLRGVDPGEMVEAAVNRPPADGGPTKRRRLPAKELAAVFGVDMVDMDPGTPEGEVKVRTPRPRRRGGNAKKAGGKVAKRTGATGLTKTKTRAKAKAATYARSQKHRAW